MSREFNQLLPEPKNESQWPRVDKIRLLSELREQLATHDGEFVLVVTREWEYERFILHFGDGPYGFQETLHLGVIKKPFLEGTGEHFRIATGEYVIDKGRFSRYEMGAIPGSIGNIDALNVLKLNQPLGEKPERKREVGCFPTGDWDEYEHKNDIALEIAVGDSAVTEWFGKKAQYGRMKKWDLDFINNPEANSEKIKHVRDIHFDVQVLVCYRNMQALLGRKIDNLPQELEEKINAENQNSKLAILKAIESLQAEPQKLEDELAKIQGLRLPRISFPLDDASYERTVREDEEELRRIKSMPIRKEFERTRQAIQKKIKEGLKMGMHKEPWVIVEEPTPGKKTEIDVPKLIRGWADYYEVPIPQDDTQYSL